MNCRQCIKLLEFYYENRIDPFEDSSLAEHVSSCSKCSAEAELMEKYFAALTEFPQRELPAGFIFSVNRKIDAEKSTGIIRSILRKVGCWLSSPGRYRIPFEAAGVLATVLIFILVFRPFERPDMGLKKDLVPSMSVSDDSPAVTEQLEKDEEKNNQKPLLAERKELRNGSDMNVTVFTPEREMTVEKSGNTNPREEHSELSVANDDVRNSDELLLSNQEKNIEPEIKDYSQSDNETFSVSSDGYIAAGKAVNISKKESLSGNDSKNSETSSLKSVMKEEVTNKSVPSKQDVYTVVIENNSADEEVIPEKSKKISDVSTVMEQSDVQNTTDKKIAERKAISDTAVYKNTDTKTASDIRKLVSRYKGKIIAESYKEGTVSPDTFLIEIMYDDYLQLMKEIGKEHKVQKFPKIDAGGNELIKVWMKFN